VLRKSGTSGECRTSGGDEIRVPKGAASAQTPVRSLKLYGLATLKSTTLREHRSRGANRGRRETTPAANKDKRKVLDQPTQLVCKKPLRIIAVRQGRRSSWGKKDVLQGAEK